MFQTTNQLHYITAPKKDSYQGCRNVLFTRGDESGVDDILNFFGPWMIDAAHQPTTDGKKTRVCALKAALI